MLHIVYRVIYILNIFFKFTRALSYIPYVYFYYKDLCFMFLYIKELKINRYIRNILTLNTSETRINTGFS